MFRMYHDIYFTAGRDCMDLYRAVRVTPDRRTPKPPNQRKIRKARRRKNK